MKDEGQTSIGPMPCEVDVEVCELSKREEQLMVWRLGMATKQVPESLL